MSVDMSPSGKSSAASIAEVVGLAATIAFVAGCIPTPVPGWSASEIPVETTRAIEPGKTTRADVLLMLADPQERIGNDDCFIYPWEERQGGVIFWTGAPMAFPIAAAQAESCHKLVIKFAPSGYVASVKLFESKTNTATFFLGKEGQKSLVCSDPELAKQIQDWLGAPLNNSK